MSSFKGGAALVLGCPYSEETHVFLDRVWTDFDTFVRFCHWTNTSDRKQKTAAKYEALYMGAAAGHVANINVGQVYDASDNFNQIAELRAKTQRPITVHGGVHMNSMYRHHEQGYPGRPHDQVLTPRSSSGGGEERSSGGGEERSVADPATGTDNSSISPPLYKERGGWTGGQNHLAKSGGKGVENPGIPSQNVDGRKGSILHFSQSSQQNGRRSLLLGQQQQQQGSPLKYNFRKLKLKFDPILSVVDGSLTRNRALERISQFLRKSVNDFVKIIVFAGHGRENTGNWILADGDLAFEEAFATILEAQEMNENDQIKGLYP